MRKIQVQTAVENNFEQEEVLSESEVPEVLNVKMSEPGELQPYPEYPQADKPEIPVNDIFFSEWASWRQFFLLLLKTGGWTAAVLLSFRFVLIGVKVAKLIRAATRWLKSLLQGSYRKIFQFLSEKWDFDQLNTYIKLYHLNYPNF